LICYEDIFNRSAVHLAKQGAQLLVNLTNDGWYGTLSAHEQHALMATMQVYQTGLPMVRATNDGVSIFLSPRSRHSSSPLFQETATVETIDLPTSPSQTFFVWSYPLMEWIWFIILILALLWKTSAPKKKIFFPD